MAGEVGEPLGSGEGLNEDLQLPADCPTARPAPASGCWPWEQNLDALATRLAGVDTLTGGIARDLVERIRELTRTERALEREITARVAALAPTLLTVCGIGAVTAAKILGEVAGPGAPWTRCHMKRLKQMVGEASVVVRTGEVSAYANVVLHCGVPF